MNKKEIIKLLKKKQDRFYSQKSKGIAFNDDDYEANYILLYIENLQSQLEIANKKLDKIKEYCNNNIIYLANSLYYHNDTDVRAIKQCEINGLDILSIIGDINE